MLCHATSPLKAVTGNMHLNSLAWPQKVQSCSASITAGAQGVDGGCMRMDLAAFCLTGTFLVARPRAMGRLRYFFHLGTYARLVKLL